MRESICTQCYVNNLARMESFWVFSPGFSSLINNISNIKQSNFDLHFLKTENFLSFKSDFDRPWSSKCLPIAKCLCSPMRWCTIMPDLNEASNFLDKLNSCHENLNFTMEIAEQNTVGMNITKCGNRLETSVHRKSTNSGLLLHYYSHVDKRTKGVYFPQWSMALIACHRLLPRFPRNVTSFELPF